MGFAGCESGICFQKSVQPYAVGLIQVSNVNSLNCPVTGRRTPFAPPENARPRPNRPAAALSLNANDASGPLVCAVVVDRQKKKRHASRRKILMTTIVKT